MDIKKIKSDLNTINVLISGVLAELEKGNTLPGMEQLDVKQKAPTPYYNDALSVFNHWNDKGIVRHRELSMFMRTLTKHIKKDGANVIKQWIDNYCSVYLNSKSWWTVKLGLKQLLKQDRFHPDNFNESDYLKKEGETDKRNNQIASLYAGKEEFMD